MIWDLESVKRLKTCVSVSVSIGCSDFFLFHLDKHLTHLEVRDCVDYMEIKEAYGLGTDGEVYKLRSCKAEYSWCDGHSGTLCLYQSRLGACLKTYALSCSSLEFPP